MCSDGAMIKQGMCDDHVENQADPTCISASEDEVSSLHMPNAKFKVKKTN